MKFTGIDELDGWSFERDKVVARKSELEYIINERDTNERTKELLRARLDELDKLHLRLVGKIIASGGK